MTPERDGSSPPVSEKQPFWGRLVAGPYAVGYHSSFQLDYARSYDLFFPEQAPFTAARRRLRPPADREPGVGDTEQIPEANEEICQLILHFFGAYLKADPQAVACLKEGGDAASGIEADTRSITRQYRPAEPISPTEMPARQDGRNCHQEREHGDDEP